MLADVRNLNGVGPELLHCDNGATVNGGLGNDEWIGILPAFEKFLLFDVLLEVGHAVDFRDERAFRRRRGRKQMVVLRGPRHKIIRGSVLDLAEGFAR